MGHTTSPLSVLNAAIRCWECGYTDSALLLNMTLLVHIVAVMRMSNFVAGLTNTNPATTAPVYKQYRYVQYNGTVGLGATVSVSFPPTMDMFRYVIIQAQHESDLAICLGEVKVFLRGM